MLSRNGCCVLHQNILGAKVVGDDEYLVICSMKTSLDVSLWRLMGNEQKSVYCCQLLNTAVMFHLFDTRRMNWLLGLVSYW